MNNIDFSQIFGFFSNEGIVNFFFKAFGIIFSIMFVIYSLVIFRQTQVMLKTVSGDNYKWFLLISGIQIIIAVTVLLLAIII